MARAASSVTGILKSFSKAVSISALQGTGVKDLLHLIREELYESYSPIHVRLPYQQGALISLFHELGQVERVEHERGGVVMQGRIPGRLLAQYTQWHVKPQLEAEETEEPAQEEE